MDVVNIFSSDVRVAALGEVQEAGKRLLFGTLQPDGPDHLVEGPMWAFVDWVMEDMAGLEMCRRLRADPRTGTAHITMVLEAPDGEDQRRALRAGADDYMVGPLDRDRVLDRVLATEGGSGQRHAPHRFMVGDLTIDMLALQARWAGKPIVLPPNEFRLLRFLAEHPDRVLTREELIAGLGKHDPPLDARTVDVWIGRLRRALKAVGAANPLRTVRSVGYVFDTP
jgi:two-component system phosphate regulon response regulator PhoB